MGMTVGELTGFIDLEDKGFASELQAAGQGLNRLQSTTSSATSNIESTVSKAFDEVKRDIADGFTPDEALAAVDRLVAGFAADLDRMEADARGGGQGILNELTSSLDRLDDNARESGRRAGQELSDGLKSGLQDAERTARKSGEDAGKSFGDGVEESGGGGGGGRLAGIGSTLVDSLKAGAMGLAVGAGLAIGQAIMSGLESAMDAEKAKQKLFAQLGATEGESKRLGGVAGKVYADAYGESMDDVSDAIKSVVQNLDGMNKASSSTLQAMTERAMDVGTVMDEDVGKVTEAVSQILRNGLAPNAEAAFDLLVKGAQTGANKSQDLLDTFVEYPTQFRALGLSGKEAMGLISQGLQAGARDADTVADALKEFAIRAQDGSDTSAKAFKGIGLNADQMFKVFAAGGEPAKKALSDVLDRIRGIEDPVQRNAVAVGLFGTKAEDLQAALLALDPSTAVAALGQVDGAAQKAGQTLNDTAASKLEAFKRGLEQNVVNFIGDQALPALERLGEGFTLSNLDEGLDEVGAKFSEVFDGIKSDTEQWVADNDAQLSQLRDTFDKYFGSIRDLVVEVLDGIKVFWAEWGDAILTVVSGALDFILSTVGGFIETLKGVFQTIKSVLTGDWQGMWNGLGSIVEGGTRGIRSLADSGMRALGEAMGFNWDSIKARGQKGISDLIAVVKELPGNLKAWAAAAGQWLLQAGRDLITGMINGVKEKAGELVNAAKGVVQGAVDGAKNLLGIHSPSTVWHGMGVNSIQGMINGASSMGPTLSEVMSGVVGRAFSSARSQAKTQMDALSADFAKWAANTKTQMDRLSADFAKWKAKNAPKAITVNENQIAPMQGVDYMGTTAGGGTALNTGSASGGTVVNVDMTGATIREEADVQKVGNEFGWQVNAYG